MSKCLWCDEPILPGDSLPNLITPERSKWHHECFFRSVVGSVGHIHKKCSCFGGTEEDPPDLTRREAARAALQAWRDQESAGVTGFAI